MNNQESLISDDLIKILSDHIDSICEANKLWKDVKYEEYKSNQLVAAELPFLQDTLQEVNTFEAMMKNIDMYIRQKNTIHSGFGKVKNGQKFVSIADILSISHKEFYKIFNQDGW